MKIEDLEYFLVVSNTLSITHAAEKLHISQQALSSKMKNLETYYGVALFNTLPNRRGIVLTAAGRILKESAMQVMEMDRRIRNYGYGENAPDSVEGVLSFGSTSTRIRHFFGKVIPAFHSAYPNVRLHIKMGYTNEVEKMLLTGALDLALGLDSFQSPHIDTIHLMQERLFAVVPRKILIESWHIDPEDDNKLSQLRKGIPATMLQRCPVLMLPSENRTRRIVDEFLRKNSVVCPVVIELNDLDSLLGFAAAGMGITFCREIVVGFTDLFHQTNPALFAFPLDDETISTQFVIGYRREYQFPSFTNHFIFLIQRACEEYKQLL